MNEVRRHLQFQKEMDYQAAQLEAENTLCTSLLERMNQLIKNLEEDVKNAAQEDTMISEFSKLIDTETSSKRTRRPSVRRRSPHHGADEQLWQLGPRLATRALEPQEDGGEPSGQAGRVFFTACNSPARTFMSTSRRATYSCMMTRALWASSSMFLQSSRCSSLVLAQKMKTTTAIAAGQNEVCHRERRVQQIDHPQHGVEHAERSKAQSDLPVVVDRNPPRSPSAFTGWRRSPTRNIMGDCNIENQQGTTIGTPPHLCATMAARAAKVLRLLPTRRRSSCLLSLAASLSFSK
ncbi:hypothetical protein PF008_g2901 [Phytophthora fragariae]|uniref:Uncharacterized protein n=1 Tax=Phytophthora fragariae TaxID=53985 RepID=A0A6G0SG04_9STRA|nr:hypothetical protein PF008_g2901 [Phytophthora fragariae]